MSLCDFVFEPTERHRLISPKEYPIARGFEAFDMPAGQVNTAYILDTKDHFIFIWGDPSQRYQDQIISASVMAETFSSYWGRSWVCLFKRSNRLYGAVDKLGLFPIFHTQQGSKHLLTSTRSQMAKRLETCCRIDSKGLIQLIAFGQMFNETSLLDSVKQLKAGRMFCIDEMSGYTDRAPKTLNLLNHSTTSLSHAVAAFHEAVGLCFKNEEQPIISLSAGLDSRLILAAALSNGVRPICLGYGQEGSADMVIAAEIANKFNLPFFKADLANSSDHWAAAHRIATEGGGEVPTQHGHALLDDKLLQLTQGRAIITGTGGEFYRAFYYDRGMPGYSIFGSTLLNEKLLPRATRYITQEFGKLSTPFFEAFPTLKPELEGMLNHVLKPYESQCESAADYMDSVYLGERVSRMVVAGQQLLDRYYDRCHPFLDPTVITEVGNLPVSYKLGSTFHRKAIEVLCPELADIRWDKTNRPLRSGLKWTEQYPALASKLKVKPSWGKTGLPMFDYNRLMSHESLDTLVPHFTSQGYAYNEVKQGFDVLLSGSSALHLKGVSKSLSLFKHELNIEQEGAAA